jgi:hypothetical protein
MACVELALKFVRFIVYMEVKTNFTISALGMKLRLGDVARFILSSVVRSQNSPEVLILFDEIMIFSDNVGLAMSHLHY